MATSRILRIFKSVNTTAWVYTRQRGCLETITFRLTCRITNFTVSKIQKFIHCANIQLVYKRFKIFKNSNKNSNSYFYKMTEIQLPLPMNGLPSYEDSTLPSYGEAIKLPSDYIKCPNDTYRLFTATKSDSPTPWTITETVTTAPGTPPSGRNRVHPDTTIDIDDEEEDSKYKCRRRLWILLIMLCIMGCFVLIIILWLQFCFHCLYRSGLCGLEIEGRKRPILAQSWSCWSRHSICNILHYISRLQFINTLSKFIFE